MSVSGYIPAYNCAGTLAEAIAAVRAQTQNVDELFVIDDGSTDNSAAIAEELGVRVLRQPRNQGRGATRARAIEIAQHNFVLCCDASVQLPPDFVERAIGWFEDSRVGAVFGRITHPTPVTAAERWRSRHLFKSGLNSPLDRYASLATGGALLNRAAVLAVGNFNVHLCQREDAELGQRLLNAGYDVIADPALVLAPLGSNTIWQTLERYRRWNVPRPAAWSDYRRHLVYSVKVMLRQDLDQGDLAAACISLLWPHYLFWKRAWRETRLNTLSDA
jgi:glycosyltransferase involved in cell wall biosynthesis